MKLAYHRCKVDGCGALTIEVHDASGGLLKIQNKGRGPLRSGHSIIDPTHDGPPLIIPIQCSNGHPQRFLSLVELLLIVDEARRTSVAQPIP